MATFEPKYVTKVAETIGSSRSRTPVGDSGGCTGLVQLALQKREILVKQSK